MMTLILGAIALFLIIVTRAYELLYLAFYILCMVVPVAFYAFLLFYGRI
jgi:hypothetical protein